MSTSFKGEFIELFVCACVDGGVKVLLSGVTTVKGQGAFT